MKRILIVDDERTARKGIYFTLNKNFDYIDEAESVDQALEVLRKKEFELAMVDLRLPSEEDGLKLIKHIKDTYPMTPILVITAYGSVESAVKAMRAGGDDYITKDFTREEILIKAHKMLEMRKLWLSGLRLTKQVDDIKNKYAPFKEPDIIVGESKKMLGILDKLARIGRDNDSTVLVTGESGTGKELVARAIHINSPRRARKKFVVVDVANMPATLLESQLFGHEKGAFTNANQLHHGFFEIADGGTVFLDEIGDFPLELQVKLLRFIQEKSFVRVGGDNPRYSDVRIIAATNKNLEKLVQNNQFREDLYYRIKVIHIHLPPLRERRDDIPTLINHFRERFNKLKGRDLPFSSDVIDNMINYDWPGNIRQLKNFIEELYVLCPSDLVTTDNLNFNSIKNNSRDDDPFSDLIELPFKKARRQLVERFELQYYKHYYDACDGNITRMAKLVGESREGISKKLKYLGLKDGS